MSISTKLDGDDLKINIVDLLSSLSGEQEKQLIEQLSCSDIIIKHVSDQLIEGLTDGGYSGFTGSTQSCSTPIDQAVRAISKSSSDMANREIGRLEHALEFSEKTKKEYMDKYFDLINKRDNNSPWS